MLKNNKTRNRTLINRSLKHYINKKLNRIDRFINIRTKFYKGEE